MSDFSNADSVLIHFGIKGMRWGVRKEASGSVDLSTPGVKMSSDGSVHISPGANIQRLVRSSGKSLPMKDMTYASINAYDNARYIKTIGGKGFFGGGRDQILSIAVTKPITAPSKDEATKIVSDMLLNDKSFRSKVDVLGTTLNDRPKEFDQIRKDPSGKTAQAWYHQVNVSMTFDKDFDPNAPAVQKAVREKFLSKGYNALRDENDVSAGIAKAPVIIFSPETSLKVTSITNITDELRTANRETLAQYKRSGKSWVDSQLYS